MHDAFEPVPILEKLPLQIDCLAAWGELRVPGAEAGSAQRLFRPFTRLGKWTGIWLYKLLSDTVRKTWDEGGHLHRAQWDCWGSPETQSF